MEVEEWPFVPYDGDVRAQASTFLVTTAAKALVLWDANVAQSIVLQGIDEEAEASVLMHKDQIVKRFRGLLTGPTGVRCTKKCRNGTMRRITLGMKLKHTSDQLTWRGSYIGTLQRFPLNTARGVTASLHVHIPAQKSHKGRTLDESFPYQKQYQHFSHDRKQGVVPSSPARRVRASLQRRASLFRGADSKEEVRPYILLDNGQRTLELCMDSIDDTDAFLHCIEAYMLQENL